MKKLLIVLATAALALSLAACTSKPSTPQTNEAKSGSYTVVTNGYAGEVEVQVTFEKEKITNIEILSDNESLVVKERAYPMIIDRILDAQTPVVDSVSGATFTSFAVKKAVAEAGAQNGLNYGEITMATQGPVLEAVKAEDVKTQLVVVGGGPAGLAAAITAKENGVQDVIVIEKMDILSGNGKFDLNFYDVFNSEAQKANGVEDSIEKFMEDMKNAGNTPERLQVWANGENEIDAWLRSFGVELNYNYGGRNHMHDKDTYAGQVIQAGMEAQAAKLGVEVRSGTKGLDFVFDGDRVVGVSVQHKNESYNIMADAVILATGGFSQNKELLAQYAPGYEVLNSSNQIGATGDFVPLFEKYGFQTENMDKIRVIPGILKPGRDLTNTGAGSVYINENGVRFVNERLGELEMGTAILEQKTVWMVVDQKKADDNANVRKQVKNGSFIKADTLEELAEMMGVDAAAFVETIKGYNALAEGKQTDEFGATPERALLAEGPYYASQIESAVHMTKGGVVANEKAQVLHEDGTVVDGLYAAGEVTWQSGGYSQSVVFGRVSGVEAAKEITGQ